MAGWRRGFTPGATSRTNAAALRRIVAHGAGARRNPSPNGFGLYDISENVHEWLADWYDANYYSVSPPRNPQGPATGVRRASRGGSWRHQIKIARVAAQQPPAGVSIQRLRVPLRAEFMTGMFIASRRP